MGYRFRAHAYAVQPSSEWTNTIDDQARSGKSWQPALATLRFDRAEPVA